MAEETSKLKLQEVNIVPFGKYRGRPIEVLQADSQYTEWLIEQPWFRDKYVAIYNVVSQNEASDTPEHNSLQVLFLDDEFCKKVLRRLNIEESFLSGYTKFFESSLLDTYSGFRKEAIGRGVSNRPIDVLFKWQYGSSPIGIEIKSTVSDDYPSILRQMKANGSKCLFLREYVGIGASRDQFVETFKVSGFQIIFLDEV
jgi:hypothetical protein